MPKRNEDTTWTTASGNRLSGADTVSLAEDFESADPSLKRADISFPRRAGRPSLTGRSAVSPQVTFRVTPELRERAELLAEKRGTTVSGLAREALEDLVRAMA